MFNTPVKARFAITTDMVRVLPFPLVRAPVTSAVALKNVLRGRLETNCVTMSTVVPVENVENRPFTKVTITNVTTRLPGGIPWLNIRTNALKYMLTVHVETQRLVAGTLMLAVVVVRGRTFTTMNLVVLRTNVFEVSVSKSPPTPFSTRPYGTVHGSSD